MSVRRWSFATALAALLVATFGSGCTFELGDVKEVIVEPPPPCEGSFATCEPGGPTCATNLLTSPDHCGACGRSCLGATCTNGRCPVDSLTTAGARAYGIALDDTHLYYSDRDGGVLRKLTKDGSTEPVVLAQNQSAITFVAVDPGGTGFVYFTRNGSDGGVSKVPKTPGGAVVTLASRPNAWEIAVDETHVYFTTRGPNPMAMLPGTIERVPKTGGAAVQLASTSHEPGSVALDSEFVYYTDKYAETVNRIRKLSPSAPEEVSGSQPGPDGIAVDGDNLFWTCFGGDSVIKRAKQNGMNIALALEQDQPNGIAASGNFVYYSTYEGDTIGRVSVEGGPPLILAGAASPIRVAVDDQYVYYTASGEEDMVADGVFRVPK